VTTSRSHLPLREVEAQALDEEVARLEHRIARVWQIFCVIGMVLALTVAAFVSRSIGLWCGLVAAGFLCWFTVHAALLARGKLRRHARMASIAIESLVPWAFLMMFVHTQGVAYALGSWVPPLLYAAVMVAWAGRLAPLVPLALGIANGVVYLTLYLVFLRHRIEPELAHLPLYMPTMQVTRSAALIVGGAMVMLVTQTLRLMFARAYRTVRAQELFGKYRLGTRIASGGMATVYQATYCPEGGFERTVAVKRIHPHLAQQAQFVASFRAEAELSARLVHPNIVQVLDFGRIDESYFLAMEYVDGLTLRELMLRAHEASVTLSPPLCAYIARELLAGLSFSHARARDARGALLRIVHRDLSPSNVLLSRHGEVKITDFGVAKALRDAAVSETRTVAGHLAYMSPEQAGAQPIDERCDIFAVGAIVWELLCGRPLFLRDGEAPTLLALIHDEIPFPSHKRLELDRAWDPIVLRALARVLDDRYRSAADMAADIAELADSRAAGASEALAQLVSKLGDMPRTGRRAMPLTASGQRTQETPTRVLRSVGS
jgi:serine/threonine-protein kinase